MESNISKKRFGVYVGVVALVFLGWSFGGIVFAQSKDTTINKLSVIELVNNEREYQGLQKLTEDELLDVVAQNKLQSMIDEQYFAHTSPQGVDPWKWFVEAGYDFVYAGENLAIDYTDINKQHTAWMNSPKHKKNILDERFTQTGVAVGQTQIDGKVAIITVQVFAKPQTVSVKSANFTPETYNMPEQLFDKGLHKEIPVLHVNTVDIYDANKTFLQKNPNARKIAWIVIGVITFFVIIAEYHIFKKKRK